MTDFLIWLGEVFGHWQNWLSGGGLGGAVLLLLYLWERLTGRTMNKQIYAAIAIAAFLFAAFFMAWRDQYHATQNANEKLAATEASLTAKDTERPKPELIGEVEQTLWVDAKPNTVFFGLLRIRNVGALPSIADGFHLKANSLNIDQAPTVFPKAIKVNNLQKQRVAEFRPDNDLTTRIMNPIAPGSVLRGWLYFSIPNIDTEKMLAAEKQIQFVDVLEHQYTIRVPNPTSLGLSYFPGSGQNPFKVDRLPNKPKQP